MRRLACKKCGGVYELQKEESPNDFDKCSCGGDLEFVDSNDKEINVNTPLLNTISKKVLLIVGIFVILAMFFYVMDPFTPTVKKMDKVIPNKVGAYYVPDKLDNMALLTDLSTKPINYHDNYSKSVDKYYFRSGSQVRIHVIMYDTGGGINVIGNKFAENRLINGKEVRFLQFDLYSYMALFHGSDYSITITAEPAFTNSHIYVNDLQNELFIFTENFISEFNK